MVYGLIAAVLVGQSFFVMMHTSIKQWFPKSLAFLLWANLTDPIVAFVSYYAVNYILSGIVGINIALRWHLAALISIILGIFIIINKVSLTQIADDIHISLGYVYSFFKWCLINMSGPIIWITWIATSSYFVIQRDGEWFVRFFIGSFVTMLVIDILKAYYAQKIINYVTPTLLNRIQKGLGIVIIMLGLTIRHRTTLCADDIDLCLEKTQWQIENLFDRNKKRIK